MVYPQKPLQDPVRLKERQGGGERGREGRGLERERRQYKDDGGHVKGSHDKISIGKNDPISFAKCGELARDEDGFDWGCGVEMRGPRGTQEPSLRLEFR